jgi:hypothetical protein
LGPPVIDSAATTARLQQVRGADLAGRQHQRPPGRRFVDAVQRRQHPAAHLAYVGGPFGEHRVAERGDGAGLGVDRRAGRGHGGGPFGGQVQGVAAQFGVAGDERADLDDVRLLALAPGAQTARDGVEAVGDAVEGRDEPRPGAVPVPALVPAAGGIVGGRGR